MKETLLGMLSCSIYTQEESNQSTSEAEAERGVYARACCRWRSGLVQKLQVLYVTQQHDARTRPMTAAWAKFGC